MTASAPTLERERALRVKGYRRIAGLDEVGRGPLAGPVVAAAVMLPETVNGLEDVRDSKQLSARRRQALVDAIKTASTGWGVGAASVREIDRMNILRATALAMRRALAHLPATPDWILVDGSPLPELRREHDAVVKGDSVSLSIAAASILAKCVRDELMTRLHARYPGFAWASNKGYGTADHLAAIDRVGLTPHHRRSFSPVGQLKLF